MLKIRFQQKGAILFIVLSTIIIIMVLCGVILSLVLSHYRFTHHQTSRIQAYYSVLAGMNLAMENLRTGTWTTTTPGNPYTLCNSGCTMNDGDIPYLVEIDIGALGTSIDGVGRRIDITATYTYTP